MVGDISRAEARRLGLVMVELARRPSARTVDVTALVDEVPPDQLVDLACHHRVPGVIYRSLLALGIDDRAFAGLRAAYQIATMSHGRCLIELQGMSGVLGELGRPWMVVKGPVLAEIAYADPGARLYEDLDLVVRPADLPSALTAIEAAGGRVADLNWPMMVDLLRAEIPVVLPNGMLADLHWDLLVTPNIRARFCLPMDELLERRVMVGVGGIDVATLDPVDSLLYLCLHGSLSGGDQLVWLKDLDQLVESQSADWDELIRRARRYRVDLVAAMQLERARVVLGAAIPVPVVAALAGNRLWWQWWRMTERWVGTARWGGHLDNGRFVSATSAGSLASLLQLTRTVSSDMAVHYLHRQPGSSGDAPGGQVPALYRAQGTTDARAQYLEMVGAGHWH